ncbi:MAG: EAL domain-containing protein [Rhodospirillaceae bacterium]|nr:EAL domain-containing protein [Rhodospirillaceae bacterium]
MDCPECERFEECIFDVTDIYLKFPLPFTCSKVLTYLGRSGLPFEARSDASARVTVPRGSVRKFLTELGGCMTDEELAATRVLTMPAGTVPQLDDFGRVLPLSRLVAVDQASWIQQMLDARNYKSMFQPMFSPDGKLVAVEALFRASDENGTAISPGYLFDLARAANMSFQVDLAARRSAVTMAAAAKLQDLQLFINFNPTSIYDPSYCLRTTVSTLEDLGFRPAGVVFEVTESDRVTNLDHLKGILAFYRRSGFKIALDDVGAGYSGLNLLNDLRPDYIKIDMHLIRGVDTDVYRQSIVGHIVGIAKDNGVNIVAEGIESDGELAWLKTQGIDLAQGYLLSRPVDAGAVRAAAAPLKTA